MYKVLQSWPKEMDTHNGHNTLCALHNFTNKLVNSSRPLMRLWPVQSLMGILISAFEKEFCWQPDQYFRGKKVKN